MSKLVEYAKSELEKAFPCNDDEMQQMAIDDVLELIEIFSNQGHSGMSAPYVLNLFDRLARWQPLLPLTGEEDEWDEPFGEQEEQQNKRCGHVFRYHRDNSTAIDSRGRVFEDKDGFTYTCRKSIISITFPYKVPDKPERVKTEE